MSSEAIPHFLVVGLGNYTHPLTRHSVGQVVLDGLAERLGITLSQDRAVTGWVGSTDVSLTPPAPKAKGKQRANPDLEESIPQPVNVKITFLKPKLLMNISGKSVTLALRQHLKSTSSKSVIVVHDSLEHKPFIISPKSGGSANGHNGVKSTIQSLGGSQDFHRIRIGIGRGGLARGGEAGGGSDVSSFVLQKMNEPELRYWRDPDGEGVSRVWEEIQKIMVK